ncbi:MAG: hypothetical protein K1X88_33520 [Nannocystaceae bacterium]|nr:hypothetical protein [Nannocystaceae bacterium]
MVRAAWATGALWLLACGHGEGAAAEQGSGDGSSGDATTAASDASTGAEASTAADDSSGGSDTGTAAGPTWAQDVAPILAAHCWSCHTDGGFAPFSLVDYDDAKPLAAGIAAISAAREMPPWPIDGTGACQSYDDARWLADDELATLAAWADAGAPPGDLAAAPSPPSPPTLGTVASTITLPPYTPVAEPEHPFDDYRCFVVDTGLPDGGSMTAFEVRPGVVEQAHHIVMFSLEDDAAVQQALALQDEDAVPGYRCFGSAGVGSSRIVGAWTPGVPVVRYPEGTGVVLAPGRPIVVQMHYNFGQSGMLDATAIDVQLGEGVTPLVPVIFVDSDLAIPPDVGDHVEESVTSFDGDAPVDLMAVFPHMHQIGRTMHVEIESAGGNACAADVPRYDFHWQEMYRYAAPVRLSPGDQVRLQCHFSSLGREGTTTWGEGSGDEMCAVVFFAQPAG